MAGKQGEGGGVRTFREREEAQCQEDMLRKEGEKMKLPCSGQA